MRSNANTEPQDERQGILPDRMLRKAVQDDVVYTEHRIPERNFQPASLDLRLGERAYSLQCSFLPHGTTVAAKLPQIAIAEIDLRDGAVLERNRPYLVPLLESLRLPPTLWAKTNPKSTTGRLDIFTRTVTDHSDAFEEIANGYQGNLYLEIFSRSFTVKVQTGISLNQLRIVQNDPTLRKDELLEHHTHDPVIRPRNLLPTAANALILSLDLEPGPHPNGYRARKNSALLDLSKVGHYHPRDFWEPVHVTAETPFILEPEEFYLLASKEEVSIPPAYAAEMSAYETTTGELRTHYAGFFDPGFGHGNDPHRPGVRPVLEVRAHDVPFMVTPGQKVCSISFERMLERPDNQYGSQLSSAYNRSGNMLSKHFIQPPGDQRSRN